MFTIQLLAMSCLIFSKLKKQTIFQIFFFQKTTIGGASACQELNKRKIALNRTKSSAAMSVRVSQQMQVPACNISAVGTIFKNKLHLIHTLYRNSTQVQKELNLYKILKLTVRHTFQVLSAHSTDHLHYIMISVCIKIWLGLI